ncbi:hypothetical protein OG2516_05313 [Oceanicola granulosus HTCC2516]|uniref:Holin-X, holin superfamily III n=1 Tax=Oceanicola granulosus (strain ATCC BAA-861 / DSM 15982 / KCTC 12143 / HTCC2516) TaxID=314256 RepID=Q2CIT9_OCEGH|nr:hypothetical protein OG2516_05313 [Oceanicola granulosus HTCC2516]
MIGTLLGLRTTLRAQAALAARRAAIGAFGLALLLMGLFFLTLAAWLGLAAAVGAVLASLILGFLFAGLGCILLVIATMRRTRVAPAPVAAPPPAATPAGALFPAAVQAFIAGLVAGLNSGRKR